MTRNIPGFAYPNKHQAVLGTLVESCLALEGLEFLVGGGWPILLRVTDNRVTHPGTEDVDLIFRRENKQIKEAATRLAACGYLAAAKTPFVRYKALRAGAQHLVFNVDLLFLWPAEVRTLFEEKLWSPFEVEATLPDGTLGRASIPLIDETAVVMLKSYAICEVTKANKRSRDFFDLYYVFSAPVGQQVASRFKALAARSRVAARNFSLLQAFVRDQANNFNQQVRVYCRESDIADPAGQIAKILAAA